MISFKNESPYIYTLYFKKDDIEYGIIHSNEIFLDRKALEELKKDDGCRAGERSHICRIHGKKNINFII